MKRTALAMASAVVSINIWTGAPLLAVWVGSRVQGDQAVSMTALFAVVAVLVVLELLLVWILSRLSHAYDVLEERPAGLRRTTPWLRSMRSERADRDERSRTLGDLERILIVTVVLGVLAFEAWFFFLAGSSI